MDTWRFLRFRCIPILILALAVPPFGPAQSNSVLLRKRVSVAPTQVSPALKAASQAPQVQATAKSVDYEFVTIDVQGFAGTSAYGINDKGFVSGFYFDVNSNLHGFLWQNNSLRQIDYPGSVDTAFGDSTSAGVVIGNYGDFSVPVQHAVLYDVDRGTWTLLPDVQGYPDNFGNGINNRGRGTGAACGAIICVGWTWDGGEYTFFQAPDADPATGGTYPNGINDRKEVAGQFVDSNGVTHGFLKDEEGFTTLNVPGASNTFASDVNAREETVGYYTDTNGNYHGFVEKHGKFITVDHPNAQQTLIYGNNSRGDIAGTWVDSTGAQHGFVAFKHRTEKE